MRSRNDSKPKVATSSLVPRPSGEWEAKILGFGRPTSAGNGSDRAPSPGGAFDARYTGWDRLSKGRPGESREHHTAASGLHNPTVERRHRGIPAFGAWIVVTKHVVDGDAEKGDDVFEIIER